MSGWCIFRAMFGIIFLSFLGLSIGFYLKDPNHISFTGIVLVIVAIALYFLLGPKSDEKPITDERGLYIGKGPLYWHCGICQGGSFVAKVFGILGFLFTFLFT